MASPRPSSQPWPLKALIILFTVICVLGAGAIALFGAWVGSTLAVYHGGPV